MKTKRTIFSIIFILATNYVCFCQNLAPDLKKALDRAEAAKEIAEQSNLKEDWLDAIIEYKKATEVDPTYSNSYYYIGFISEAIEDFENAIKYYNKYLALDPDSPIAEEIQTKVNKIEFKKEKLVKQQVFSKSINGLWKSDLINEKTGRPYWIFTIDQFDNDMRVSISPKSFKYRKTFTFPTAIALKDKNKFRFMFTTDVTLNPQEDLYKAADIISALDNVQSAISSIPVPVPLGAASSLISAIPVSKAKDIMQTYIFSLDLADTTKLLGKYNAKEYLKVQGQTPKTVSDSIIAVTFTKMDQSELNSIKIKYKNKRSAIGALALSTVLPGGGQFLNKQRNKGFIILGSELTLTALVFTVGLTLMEETYYSDYFETTRSYYWYELNDFGSTLIVLGGGIHLFSMIDAIVSASRINRENGFTIKRLYENNNLCLKIQPSISPLTYMGKSTFVTGLGLSMNFK